MADQVKMPDGSVQAFHVNADSFADVFATADAKGLNLTRMERAAKLIKGAPQADVKEALRGPTADEKKAGNKLPPFVRSCVARGMQESAARARLSELRNLWNAYLEGFALTDDVVQAGYDKAHDAAKQWIADKRKVRQQSAVNAFYAECIAKVRSDMGIPIGTPMTAEQALAADEAAANLYKQRTQEQDRDARQARLNADAEKALNDDDPQYAVDLANLILERYRIRSEAAQRRAEDQAAMPKNQPQTQAPQGAQEGPATVESMAGQQQPATERAA